VLSRTASFETGELKKTDAQLDIAILGEGLLEVVMPDGGRAYTRGGSLKVDAEGNLALQSGPILKAAISVPANTEKISIASDGTVSATLSGEANPVELGRMELARFQNQSGLSALGDGLFRATESSGEPVLQVAGEEGAGRFVQGFIELSNVKLVDEMVSLMIAQRAYEASLKVAQASDEMLSLINNLRK
jgi:flagellar basal-body rod protein FlgG